MAEHTPRILLAAASSGSGKTLLTCGLLEAFKRKNVRLASFKCGPDYIDPMFHRSVLEIESRNLDSFFTGRETLRYLLARGARGAELSVIEGVMGYFDGLGGFSSKASTSEVAAYTETPVILVVNCRGMSLSAVPLIKGFLEYEEAGQIKGVLLNQVSPMVYPRMKEVIERELPVRVYGYVPKLTDCLLESRHLGLKRPDEIADLKERLVRLAEVIEKTVDLDGLMDLGKSAPDLSSGTEALKKCSHRKEKSVRIGVASDEAFNFYYKDNFSLLEELGAELIPFSPLHDRKLPEKLCGMLLGGGYPELYARELSENEIMKREIKRSIEDGIPCLAECGGFLYLHEFLEDEDGNPWPMAGVIDGRGFKTPKLSRFGYVTLTAGEDTIIGKKGERFPAHEFHYWDSTCNGRAFLAEKPTGKKSWECIVNKGNLLAGFPHFYYYGNKTAAENFLKKCQEYKMEKELEMRLKERLREVKPLCEEAMKETETRWDHIAKPLKSLGILEKNVTKIAGIAGDSCVSIKKRALIAMCADNGVVEEGVTQTGQEVTAVVAENMATGSTTVTVMADAAGVDVFPVDIGMVSEGEIIDGIPEENEEIKPRTLLSRKVRRGTRNLAREAAMTREEALRAVLVGIELAGRLKAQGYDILATGEMGIGNTTTSSAVAAAFLSQPVERMTGKGAGLSDEGLQKKICVIKTALENLKPDKEDPIDVLCKVGGYDIAGMMGVFLGGAVYRIPVLIDGFISSVSALLSEKLLPSSRDFMVASHVSKEPAGGLVLEALGLQPMLCCEMCLGEGTGGIAALSVLDMGFTVYHKMATFDDMNVEQYKPL